MSYVKTVWQDLPDRTTPITAARLNKLETQYDEVAADIGNPETPVGAALNSTIETGRLTLDPTKKYKVVTLVMRNFDDVNYWQPLIDAGHEAVNFLSADTTATRIRVNYSVTGAKVVGASVQGGATVAEWGIIPGASVGTSFIDIRFNRVGTESLGSLIQYNGSAWTSSDSAISAAFNTGTGVLTVTHPTISGAKLALTPHATPYSVNTVSPGPGATSVPLEFRTSAGAQVTTPDTNMKFFFYRDGARKVTGFDPRTVRDAGLESLWMTVWLEMP